MEHEQPARLRSVCPDCGDVFERDDSYSRCPECKPRRSHRPSHEWKSSPESRGYDWTWRKLSRRARALSPQCEDCGTVEDLTTDHSEEAWRRREAGLVIRLEDVAVVCRVCNAERGAARGDNRRHEQWERPDMAQLADELDRDDD